MMMVRNKRISLKISVYMINLNRCFPMYETNINVNRNFYKTGAA